MWGAAPRRCRRILPLALLALLLGLWATPAPARVGGSGQQAALASSLWAVGLNNGNLALFSNKRASEARAAGLNTLLVDPSKLGRKRARRIKQLVSRYGFQRITQPHRVARSLKRGEAACARHPKRLCTLLVHSLTRAHKFGASNRVDLVVVRLKRLPSLASLQALRGSKVRVVVMVEIGRQSTLDQSAWSAVIAEAASDASLDLGVAPVGKHRARALTRYLGFLGRHGPSPPPPPPTPPAPPPKPASVFMSTGGSNSNPCTKAQPCKSFDRAYRVAKPGDTVEVAGGSYPGQAINPDSSKTSSSDVVFRPASGASVTMSGELEANGAHFEVRDMTLNQVNFPNSANDITLRNIVNHGMWWQGSSNISIIGGEISCPTCDAHSHMQNSGSTPPHNILFDGVYFHDWQSQAGEHVECLQILGGDGITIRNSVFKNCGTGNGGLGATADLHLQTYGSPAPKNILIENNFFYASGNPYVIQGEDFVNLDFRYNSMAGPLLLYDGPSPGTGIDIVGNILPYDSWAGCNAQQAGDPINWSHNVMSGGTCGASDKNAAPGFVDKNSNLHLTAGSAARNAGDPGSFPGTDIDGQSRPLGGLPDAGADEAG